MSVNGRTDFWPSWYKKDQGTTSQKIVFDQVSKKRATECTPDAARIELDVRKTVDPVTKKDVFIAPDGYNASGSDDRHKCDDAKPGIASISASNTGLQVTVSQGTFPLQSLEVKVDGQSVSNVSVTAGGTFTIPYTFQPGKKATITATVLDTGMYSGTRSTDYN